MFDDDDGAQIVHYDMGNDRVLFHVDQSRDPGVRSSYARSDHGLFSHGGPEVESRKKQPEDIDNAHASGPR